MLDPWSSRITAPVPSVIARALKKKGISADQVTVTGFLIGLSCLPLLWAGWYAAALTAIAVNRILDGVDGHLARITTPSDAGGFLDIVLDFIFYGAVIFGFALADPVRNSLWAALLLFSFIGTGSSFLAFSALAGRHGLENPDYPLKSLYYLGGITEGTETIVCFVLMCLMPERFGLLAAGFAILCWITTLTRLALGYHTLKSLSRNPTS